MANSSGGHIVVGALEEEGILAGFVDPELPETWEGGLRRVAGSFLRPTPQIFTQLVGLDPAAQGVEQLIIEVMPSEVLVVVTNPADPRARLMVPIRHGSHTLPLAADRAIMQLSSPFRRWSIHLERIRADDGRIILLTDEIPAGRPYGLKETFVAVQDLCADSVTFKVVKGHHPGVNYIAVPFDYIEAIWRSPNLTNCWYLVARGIIDADEFRPRRG